MSLNRKLFLMLFLLMAFSLGAVVTGVLSLQSTNGDFKKFASEDTAFLSEYENIHALGLQRGQAVRDLLLNPKDNKAHNTFVTTVTESERQLAELIRMAPMHGVEASRIQAIKDLTDKDIDIQEQAISMGQTDSRQAISLIVDKETPAWRGVEAKYLDTEKVVLDLFAQKSASVDRTNQTRIVLLYVLTALFLVSSAAIFWYLRKFVTRPVALVSKQVNRVAEGDLDVPELPTRSKDEIGDLARATNSLVLHMRNLVGQIKTTSEELAGSAETLTVTSRESERASRQVAETIEELASGTETQMRGTEDSNRAMGEMAAGVQRIAASSGEAAEMAGQAAKHAEVGRNAIQRTTGQMEAIRASVGRTAGEVRTLGIRSEEIGQIVSTIGDISTQTQLLALNASIEAARAGEAGRGFAVVAGEIRKLSEQTQASAMRIAELIEAIQAAVGKASAASEQGLADVEAGGAVVKEANEAFGQILSETGRVAGQIEEISAASEEMSAGSEQIQASLEEMAKTAHAAAAGAQNAAAATQEQHASIDEIASSAAALNETAGMLKQLIERFTL